MSERPITPRRLTLVPPDDGLAECEFCHAILNHFGHAQDCADIARTEARLWRAHQRAQTLADAGVDPGQPLIDFTDTQED